MSSEGFAPCQYYVVTVDGKTANPVNVNEKYIKTVGQVGNLSYSLEGLMSTAFKRCASSIFVTTILSVQFPLMPRPTSASHFRSSLATTSEKRSHKADPAAKHRLMENYGNLPLGFETNDGQFDASMKFVSRGNGYSLGLAQTEAILALHNGDTTFDLRMKFLGANPNPRIEGVDPLPGKSNYIIGNDPSKWRTGIENYAKVRYREIYRFSRLLSHAGRV